MHMAAKMFRWVRPAVLLLQLPRSTTHASTRQTLPGAALHPHLPSRPARLYALALGTALVGGVALVDHVVLADEALLRGPGGWPAPVAAAEGPALDEASLPLGGERLEQLLDEIGASPLQRSQARLILQSAQRARSHVRTADTRIPQQAWSDLSLVFTPAQRRQIALVVGERSLRRVPPVRPGDAPD